MAVVSVDELRTHHAAPPPPPRARRLLRPPRPAEERRLGEKTVRRSALASAFSLALALALVLALVLAAAASVAEPIELLLLQQGLPLEVVLVEALLGRRVPPPLPFDLDPVGPGIILGGGGCGGGGGKGGGGDVGLMMRGCVSATCGLSVLWCHVQV